MTPGVVGFQQAGLRSMSSRKGRWCAAIISWMFNWSQVSWTWKRKVFGILSLKLGRRKIYIKLMPILLNDDQEHCMQVCQDIILHNKICFMESLLVRTLVQPRNQVPEQSEEVFTVTEAEYSKTIKVMLIMFFNIRGFIYSKFLSQGQMINQQVYLEIL